MRVFQLQNRASCEGENASEKRDSLFARIRALATRATSLLEYSCWQIFEQKRDCSQNKHRLGTESAAFSFYGALREFIWHDSLSSAGPITVSKKKDSINQSMSLFASVVARSQWGKTQKFRMWRGREHYGWNIKKLRCLQWRVWTCLYCIDRTVKLYNLAEKGPYVLQNCFFFATRYTLTRQNKAQ